MDDRAIGELMGMVKAIKEDTDRIPQLSEMLIRHDEKINDMHPKVERHEKTSQRAIGIAAACGIMAGVITDMVKDMFNHG